VQGHSHRRLPSDGSWSEERDARISPARLAVLGLLVERPAHRYEVALRFNQRVGPAWGMHRSQVYQAVYGLERDGLVERVTATSGEKSPDVYCATSRGRELFETWLASDACEDPRPIRNTLVVRLGFLRAEHVPGLLELINGREHVILSRIREYSEACPELGEASDRTDWTTVGLHLILEGTVAALQGELRWMRRVRGTLESLPVAPGPRSHDDAAA
jgi:DNA-binding PadR family transcriptional regulator